MLNLPLNMANIETKRPDLLIFDRGSETFRTENNVGKIEPVYRTNGRTKEVWYTFEFPFLTIGTVFQLQNGIRLDETHPNLMANMAITIAEIRIKNNYYDDYSELLAEMPTHFLNIGSWRKWPEIIGTDQPVVTFHNHIHEPWDPYPIQDIYGISFGNAVWAFSKLTSDLLSQANLMLDRNQYLKLMQPFGVVDQ